MIYIASSWRNPYYEKVVKRLKKEGLPVYDFRNPPHGGGGFHWTDVDENAPNWTFKEYAEGLHHPLAERQFEADLEALNAADTCVLVLPYRSRMDGRCRQARHCLYPRNGGT